MLFHLTSTILSASSAFLYPAYASYKTLSQRPASEEDLERWLMYWSVLGCVVAVEYVAEWIISWVPFYYTIKTLFLLYLALPQTQGSTYLYLAHLHPFFARHEAQIDHTLASLKQRAYAFIQDRFRLIWEQLAMAMGQQPQQQNHQHAAVAPPAGPGGPAQYIGSFWSSYGPSIIAGGTALLWQGASKLPTGPGATIGTSTTATQKQKQLRGPQLMDRRKQLEAELAALNSIDGSGVSGVPMPTRNGSSASIAGSMGDLRSREHATSGRFEEIEVPSDVEGYEVGDEGVGYAQGQQQKKSTGWFGGWGAGGKAGYEKVAAKED